MTSPLYVTRPVLPAGGVTCRSHERLLSRIFHAPADDPPEPVLRLGQALDEGGGSPVVGHEGVWTDTDLDAPNEDSSGP